MTQLAFLLDVDNTLLANDEVKQNLDQRLHAVLGEKLAERFWEIYEQVRKEKSVVDIPLALQRLRAETPVAKMDDATYQRAHAIFEDEPFSQYLYPHVIETLHHLRELGSTIIVSDGDQYFQAEKIVNSHLAAAVEGRVLIYIHKQQHLDEIMQRYPAEQYVMIDDKAQILADIKAVLGKRLTTVFVRQGKYARQGLPANFQPDISVDHIGELRAFSAEQFLHV